MKIEGILNKEIKTLWGFADYTARVPEWKGIGCNNRGVKGDWMSCGVWSSQNGWLGEC